MKRIFALLLTLALLASSGAALAAGGYTDVPDSHWAAASIQSAKTYGLMSGMTSNTFGLGQTITRAQFVTVTARMLGWDTKTTTASGFTDTKGHWAEGAISAAVQHGALDKGGSFRPDAAISREDMAVILVRALGYQSVARTEVKTTCLSICSPIQPITFPIVKAASTVPMPRPLMWPKNTPVNTAVTTRQITSKGILIFEYGSPVMSASSRGNRSVGMIGIWHRFESAMPKQITR